MAGNIDSSCIVQASECLWTSGIRLVISDASMDSFTEAIVGSRAAIARSLLSRAALARSWPDLGEPGDPCRLPDWVTELADMRALWAATMRKLAEYEQHAFKCREMAATARDPEHSKQLEEIADGWTDLADDRWRQIGRGRNGVAASSVEQIGKAP